MSDQKTVEEVVNVEETVEVEEVSTDGKLSKLKTGLKKYGKKIAAGAAVVTVGLIGYALGARSRDESDTDAIDTDYEIYGDGSSDEVTKE